MTQAEFDTAFERLQAAFEHPVKDATARLYYDVLQAYHPDDWQRAVRASIAEDDRWPRVGMLLKRLRDATAGRQEQEQRRRAEAARARATTTGPVPLREVLPHGLQRAVEAWGQARRGEITAAAAAEIQQAVEQSVASVPSACAACQDSGLLHWEAPAPPGHPFAGNLYATCGRCRCAAGRAWDIPPAPAALQPVGA